MMTRQQAWRRLALVILVFAAISFAHSFFLPLHEAPDEVAHFLFTRFIADTGRLPLNLAERESAGYKSYRPALYHMVTSALVSGYTGEETPRLKFVWESPRFELATELLNTKRLANTEDELPPFGGDILMWHRARLISILLSISTIIVVFIALLELQPGQYWLALVSAAILAFIPAFVFTSSSMSTDPLTGLILALYLWVMIKLIQQEPVHAKVPWKYYTLLGLLMGVGTTVNYAVVLLPVQIVGMVTFLAWRYQLGWYHWLARIGITGITAVVSSSWWFIYLIINFNEIDKYGVVLGTLKPIIAGGFDASQKYVAYLLTGGTIGIQDSPEFISEPFWLWAVTIFQSFWVRQIETWPLGPAPQILIGVVCIVAVIGLMKMWRREPVRRIWIGLFVTHFLLFLVFPLLRQIIQGNVSQTGQGRHVLFPTVVAFPLLLVYGWQGWLSAKTQRRLALALVGGLLCWSLVQLAQVIDYPLLYLPIRTTAEAATNIPHRLDQTFGDNLDLLGYDLNINPADDALNLKLYWHSRAYVDEDYRMSLILSQNGEARFRWSSYPLNARYPTRIWESWETIRDDIALPLVDVPPGDYQLQLQLFGLDGSLPVDQAGMLTLTDVLIPASSPPPSQIPLTAVVDGRTVVQGASLWQAERYRRWQLPEYRPRMQIAFIWQGEPAPDERVEWLLVAPDGQVFADTPVSPHFGYFPVGLDWPPGDYRLRMELWRGETVTASEESEPLVTVINKTPRLLEPPPMAHSVEANFAGQIKLLGYDLPVRSLTAGQGVPVTLYWRGLRTMGADYTVFAKLLDNQQQLWGSTERLPADGYNTFRWLENEVVIDGFELPVEPNPPPGVYWLNVGLYQEVSGAAVSLPLVAEGQPIGETSVTFGPIKIGGPPPGVVVDTVAPDHPIQVDFGDTIRLRGYDIAKTEQNLSLTFFWESLAPTKVDYTVFVHVRNQAGETVAQMDRPPADGAYPTSLWDTGELIPDTLTLPLPPDLSPGEYSVVVGLYDFTTGQRLAISGATDGSLKLNVVEIP